MIDCWLPARIKFSYISITGTCCATNIWIFRNVCFSNTIYPIVIQIILNLFNHSSMRFSTVASIWVSTLIMHQHPSVTNEVGMEILYLKVVDSNGFFQALGDNIGDDSFGAIGQPHDHAGVQGACLDPALALNVEGMLRGGVDGLGLAVLGGNGHMGDLAGGIDESTGNFLVGDFAGFLIFCQHHIARLDTFNGDQARRCGNGRASHEAHRCYGSFCGHRHRRGDCRIAPDLTHVVAGHLQAFRHIALCIKHTGHKGRCRAGHAVGYCADGPFLPNLGKDAAGALAAELAKGTGHAIGNCAADTAGDTADDATFKRFHCKRSPIDFSAVRALVDIAVQATGKCADACADEEHTCAAGNGRQAYRKGQPAHTNGELCDIGLVFIPPVTQSTGGVLREGGQPVADAIHLIGNAVDEAADSRTATKQFIKESAICQPCRVPIGGRVAGSVLIPVHPILDRVHGHPGAVGGVVEAGLGKVDVEGGIVDVAGKGGKDVVAVIVVHQLVRADRLTPGVVLQLGKVLAGRLGVIPGVAHHVLVDVQGALPAAVALLGDLLDPLRTGVHMALLVFQLAVAHRIDVQIVILRAGVVDHIVSVIGLARMGGDQVIDPQAQTVVGVGRGIALPVRAFHQTVGSIVHEGLRSLLAGFGKPEAKNSRVLRRADGGLPAPFLAPPPPRCIRRRRRSAPAQLPRLS